QPSGEGPRHRQGRDHLDEPRLRGRQGQPAEERAADAHFPVRRFQLRTRARRPAGFLRAVPPGSLARTARQSLSVSALCRIDADAQAARGVTRAMGGWVEFLDSAHPIYVNDRHRDVHYRIIANAIAAYVPSPAARVLDYGCGDALHADVVAAAASHLILCEAGPHVREAVARRFAGNGKIEVIAPAQVQGLPERSLDLIVMHSVAQYLTTAELAALLALFRRLLKPGGLLV